MAAASPSLPFAPRSVPQLLAGVFRFLHARKAAATAVQAIFFIVALIALLCAVIYGAMMVAYSPASERFSDLIGVLPFWLVGMLVGALGIGLIVAAVRRL